MTIECKNFEVEFKFKVDLSHVSHYSGGGFKFEAIFHGHCFDKSTKMLDFSNETPDPKTKEILCLMVSALRYI